MESLTLIDRKIPQSFGLTAQQIADLQERSRQTGKSLSDLAREAIDRFLSTGKVSEK
jgi:hypothetical protein